MVLHKMFRSQGSSTLFRKMFCCSCFSSDSAIFIVNFLAAILQFCAVLFVFPVAFIICLILELTEEGIIVLGPNICSLRFWHHTPLRLTVREGLDGLLPNLILGIQLIFHKLKEKEIILDHMLPNKP